MSRAPDTSQTEDEVENFSDHYNKTVIMELLRFTIARRIEEKYLVQGHTQMECDSVHAVIERKIKNKPICLPSDYSRLCQQSRKIDPYETITLNHISRTLRKTPATTL